MSTTDDSDRTSKADVERALDAASGDYEASQPAYLGVDYACVVEPVETFGKTQRANLTNTALDATAAILRNKGFRVRVRNGTGVLVFK